MSLWMVVVVGGLGVVVVVVGEGRRRPSGRLRRAAKRTAGGLALFSKTTWAGGRGSQGGRGPSRSAVCARGKAGWGSRA